MKPPPRPVRIFSPQAAYIISDILADPLARFRIFGASTAMNPPYHLAIKTGTSTRYRDVWAVGYTPEYTLAVWVGNFDGRATLNLSGAAAAAPILADLAALLFHGNSPQSFSRPEGVTSAVVCHFSGLRPGPDCVHVRQELFIAGTEPTGFCSYHHHQEPWHRIPTTFAGWLHQRFEKGGVGRYRLADFEADLPQSLSGSGRPGARCAGQPGPSGQSDPGRPPASPRARRPVSRSCPLPIPWTATASCWNPGWSRWPFPSRPFPGPRSSRSPVSWTAGRRPAWGRLMKPPWSWAAAATGSWSSVRTAGATRWKCNCSRAGYQVAAY